MRQAGLRDFPFFPAVVAAVLGAVASVLLAWLDIGRQASEERSRVVTELAAVRARLEGTVKATFSSTDGLVHLVSLRGGIDPDLFAGMARLAVGKNSHIRNITLAPDDAVQLVYPLAGNEKVVGFRYATNPEQLRTVQLARERGEPVLAGPVNLVQGGLGLINRAPVFTRHGAQDGQLRYWGIASVVAYVDSILSAGDFPAASAIRIALRGKDGHGANGDLIDGDPAIFEAHPVLMDVQIPGGSWQLGAVPAAGWQASMLHR
ncbi:MAG: CHASE domain-containing protein, partial [Rhodocyclaceae bacterium]|nr:CHASE domain-containing protein [Rhodocyclaceae bacterium]